MPTISVIMGVYNSKSKEILSRAINSILNQTFTDFEFIICNDCSTVEFIKPLLEDFKQKDNRIIVIENDVNSGLAFSLNKCIKIAKGEFIARQDDDDISLPNRLQKEYDFLVNNQDYSFVGSNIYLICDSKVWGHQELIERPMIADLKIGCTFAHPTLLIRIQDIKQVGCYTVSKITRRAEDYDLYFKLYSNKKLGYNLQEHLLMYNQSIETVTKRKMKFRIDEYKLRKSWFKKLKFSFVSRLYRFKPIIAGISPNRFVHLRKLRKYRYSSIDLEEINKELQKYM